MAKKKSFLPKADPLLILFLQNFLAKFKVIASPLLGYTQSQVDAVEKDVLAIIHSILIETLMKSKLKDFTSYKENLVKGTSTGQVVSPPVPGTLPVLTDAVEPGALKRILKTIKDTKDNANYTTDMGNDMGIIGADHVIDYDEISTVAKLKSNLANGIKIKYTKKGLTGADIYRLTLPVGNDVNDAELNNAVFTKIASVTGSVYEDTLLNQSRQPEIRIYKIYLKKGDVVVGKPSNYLRVVAEVYVDQQGNELQGKVK